MGHGLSGFGRQCPVQRVAKSGGNPLKLVGLHIFSLMFSSVLLFSMVFH